MPRKFAHKYVIEDRTDGVLRFYFRRKGQPKVRLPGVPGTDEFNRAYYGALTGGVTTPVTGALLSSKGTLRWLCEQYFASADYKRLNEKTKRVRRQILETCWEEPVKPGSSKQFGDIPLPVVTAKSIRVLRDRKAELPEAGNGRVKALRQVYAWATQPAVEMVLSNPARDVAYFKSGSEGHHSWSIAEVEKFEERHPIGTKARLALALLLYTMQRRGDVILFGRQHVRDGWLHFTQQKNKSRKPVTLDIPIHPDLQHVIDSSACGDLTFLVTEFGRGFSANGFGNWFRKKCDQAGLAHCSAHGLRKAGASRLADKGASEHQIMAMTGHQTSKEVTRYTRAARQKVLARSVLGLMAKPDDDG